MTKKGPLLSRTVVILLVSMIAANIGGQMYGPLLPLYVQQLGASIEQIGLFFTLSMIAPLMFQILGGWLSDSLGRVQAMAIGSLAGLGGYIVFTIAPSWGWLLLAMVGISVATSFVGPSFQALVAEESKEENRGRVFGLVQSSFLITGVIGAPLGGFLSDQVGFRWMFAVAASLYALATVIRVSMARRLRHQQRQQESDRPAPSFSGLKKSLATMAALIAGGGIITWIFLSDGVMDISFNMVGNLFPLYFNNIMGISMTQLGFLGAVASLVTMALTTFGGLLSDKVGERVGIILGNAALVSALVIMLNVSSFPLFILAWGMLGLGQALVGPAYNSLISKVVPNNMRGIAFGFFSTSLGVISLPSPYIGTWLWQRFSPRAPFYVLMTSLLALMPLIWIKFRLPGKGAASPGIDPNAPEGEGGPLLAQASSEQAPAD
jgi:MFS family permease